jgi:DtxR family Mn-dependent transcriptional regulator
MKWLRLLTRSHRNAVTHVERLLPNQSQPPRRSSDLTISLYHHKPGRGNHCGCNEIARQKASTYLTMDGVVLYLGQGKLLWNISLDMYNTEAQMETHSENAQMYLVTILRLGQDGWPVPLSKVAAALGVSAVSANLMCRKLEDEGLADYTPYRGVAVTDAGRRLATGILRRHRLWEVFLVDHLSIETSEAHDMACRLEHATSDVLADRLASFLSNPEVNPQGQPIPSATKEHLPLPSHPLSDLVAGQGGYVVRSTGDNTARGFLSAEGLRPGVAFLVSATSDVSLLLRIGGGTLSINRDLAATVQVTPRVSTQQPSNAPTAHQHPQEQL